MLSKSNKFLLWKQLRLLKPSEPTAGLSPFACYHRNTSCSLAALLDVAYYNGFTIAVVFELFIWFFTKLLSQDIYLSTKFFKLPVYMQGSCILKTFYNNKLMTLSSIPNSKITGSVPHIVVRAAWALGKFHGLQRPPSLRGIVLLWILSSQIFALYSSEPPPPKVIKFFTCSLRSRFLL